MSSDLAIGPLDPEIEKHVVRICSRIGLKGWPVRKRWPNLKGWLFRSTLISLFNVASLALFLDYVAGLEGLSSDDAMTRTSFRNLPCWLLCVWLPIEFDPPAASDEDDPSFVGSSIRLAHELATIKSMATLDLGAIPPSYRDMRKDYRRWFRAARDPEDRLSDEDIVRWIWNALNEAAQLSIKRKVPILLCP